MIEVALPRAEAAPRRWLRPGRAEAGTFCTLAAPAKTDAAIQPSATPDMLPPESSQPPIDLPRADARSLCVTAITLVRALLPRRPSPRLVPRWNMGISIRSEGTKKLMSRPTT